MIFLILSVAFQKTLCILFMNIESAELLQHFFEKKVKTVFSTNKENFLNIPEASYVPRMWRLELMKF